jgi:hypothetical protein
MGDIERVYCKTCKYFLKDNETFVGDHKLVVDLCKKNTYITHTYYEPVIKYDSAATDRKSVV